ncbi:MAG: class II aldolase/adducin family protein [Kiritimatiellae bacterium]|nr:class II aldolase/adducin family protein [Kiritimatiellia bacterium]
MDKSLYIKPPLVDRHFDWTGINPVTREDIDKFFTSAPIVRVKEQMVEMGKRLYARGYVDGNGGNISVRVGEDLVLCSPTLCSKGYMTVEDICLVDMDAGQLCGYRPATSEVKCHIAMMKTAGHSACIHAHPPHCGAFVFAGITPPNGINPEADIFTGQIPLAPYNPPGSPEVAESVAEASKRSNVVFMENHGVITGGRDVEECEWFMENADQYCRMVLLSTLHGQPLNQVNEKHIEEFVAWRKSLGFSVPEGQAPYNTRKFHNYNMGTASN